MKFRALTAGLAATALAFGVAACGDDENAAAPATQDAAPKASLTITTPEDGTTSPGTINAKVALEGFEIDKAAVGMAAEEGKGHLHFALDEGKYDTPKYSGANGKLAKQLGVDGKYSPSVTDGVTYTNIPAGEHTLEVYAANNDHTNTGTEDKVTFTVE